MTDIDGDIEPPGLDTDEDDDGDPYTGVHITIVEHDGTRRAGYGGIPGNASDTDVAAALTAGLRAVAASRGPGLVRAVRAQLVKELSE